MDLYRIHPNVLRFQVYSTLDIFALYQYKTVN